jgi:serine/threonine-protein kinase
MCEAFQGVIALLFDESPSFSAPAVFGSYRVLHQVGSGVLGPVFRTSDPRRPDLVAIKAFKLDLRPDEVVRLADALRRLAAAPPIHPAIAAVVDAGLEGTTPFLATEYLIGDTLDVVLRRRAPVPVSEALQLLTPVAAALDAAWTAGVGHGGLHPRDVFAGSEAQAVKVTGIGIAQAMKSAGLKAPVRRPYAAQERAGGVWDQRADVYSLAVIAHELLTGRRPAGPNEQDGVFAAGVSPEQRVAIRRVLARALSERPDDRFATAGEFLQALSALEAPAVVRPLPVASDADQPDLFPMAASELDAGPTPGWWLPDDEVPVPAGEDTPPPTAEDRAIDLGPAEPDLLLTSHGSVHADFEPAVRTPVDDLAYRAPEAAPTLDEWRTEEPAVPGWRSSHVDVDVQPSRSSRWVAVVGICLLAGVGAGYVAATYDPLGPPESQRLADSQLPQAVVPPEAMPADAAPVVPAPDPDPPVIAEEAAPVPPLVRREAPAPPAAAPAPPAGGALAIRSDPSGAMVTVDGRIVGETPLVLRDLAAGPYMLQIARPGYAPHAERVTVPASGRERTLSVELEAGVTSPGQALGAIDVDSMPRGARVFVDGRFVGQSPLRVPELRPGTHTVTLELANRSSVIRRTVVEPGKIAKLIVALQ